MTALNFSCLRPKLRLSGQCLPSVCKALGSSPGITITPKSKYREGNIYHQRVKGIGYMLGDSSSECLAMLGESLHITCFLCCGEAGIIELVQGSKVSVSCS